MSGKNVRKKCLQFQGTDVTHNISFGDNSPKESTTKISADHVYTVNGTYTITVVSYNDISKVCYNLLQAQLSCICYYMQDTNTIDIKIIKLECTAPVLEFVTSHFVYPRSTRFLLEARLLLNNCTTYVIHYTWTIYRQDDCVITPSSQEQVVNFMYKIGFKLILFSHLWCMTTNQLS